MSARLCSVAVVVALAFGSLRSQQEEPKADAPPDPMKEYAALLKQAGIDEDPKSLVEFFRKRTLSDDERAKLLSIIKNLGSRDFDVREQASELLLKGGLASVPILRAALQDRDEEIVRRVERCLAQIEQQQETQRIIAAAHILASKKHDGTVGVLLEYLPSIPNDQQVFEGIRSALILHTKTLGKADPILTKGLADKEFARRALAVSVIAEALPSERAAVVKLLDDPHPEVRYQAGTALLRAREKKAVPAIISLLEEGPQEYAYQAEDLLCQLLGEDKPPATLIGADAANRKATREAWDRWWKANEKDISMAKIGEAPPLKGLTIIVEVDGGGVDGGRIWECGPDGKQRWEMTNLGGPVDVQVLPGGRFLIGEYYSSRVTERDKTGKILWESPKQTGNVVSAQRLLNGNTLIATMQYVSEITREGKTVAEYKFNTTVYHARKNVRGHTFVLVGNQLIEYDANKKEGKKLQLANFSGWAGFEFLGNNRFLVAYYSTGNSYADVDSEGKKLFEHSTTGSPTRLDPTRAQRLRNGNTLVAGGNVHFVVEYDRDKKEVWKVASKGRPFSVLRY